VAVAVSVAVAVAVAVAVGVAVTVGVTVDVDVGRSKLAVIVRSPVIVTEHDPVPLQPPPLHPVNTAPPPAKALRLTLAPGE
jgi:hypothetical protein